MMIRLKQWAENFQAFLRLVHRRYRHRKALMILDGDSSHTAAGSQQLAQELEIDLQWLPVRSPELNPVEDLWRDAKEVICANHQHSNIDQQAQELVQYIQQFSNHHAKCKAGLLSEGCWIFQ